MAYPKKPPTETGADARPRARRRGGPSDPSVAQVLSPGLAFPSRDEAVERLRQSAIRLTGGATVAVSKARLRAGRWHEAKLEASGLRHTPVEHRPRIQRLAAKGARLVGPMTTDEADEVFARLHATAPWFAALSDYLWRDMKRRIEDGKRGFCPPPLILIGEPGTGKSQYARTLAAMIGLDHYEMDVGSGTAGFRVSGLERGWGSAMPGIPVDLVLDHLIANPVILVNEIDKASALTRGTSNSGTSITTSLLQMLEPGTARAFDCPFYRQRFDMSHVIWIMTANELKGIPEPLRDRSRIFQLPSPTLQDLIAVFEVGAADLDDDQREVGRRILQDAIRSGRAVSLRLVARLLASLRASRDDRDLH